MGSNVRKDRNSLEHIYLDKNNGETPVASDQLRAQAAFFR